MSFSLEFYSLSWNTLKSALIQRKPELIRAVQERQWDRLLTDTDLARNNDDKGGLGMGPEAIFADGFDEIADAMAAQLPPRGDPPDIKQDEDWQAVAQNAEAWLNETVKSLKAAAAAKTDLVTLYLTAPEHYSSYRAELQDEVLEDFSFIGKIKSFIGRYI